MSLSWSERPGLLQVSREGHKIFLRTVMGKVCGIVHLFLVRT